LETAPLLCAGFTTYNALLKGGALPGDLVAIQGIGGLGHLGIQYARKMGLRVASIARGTAKAELSVELGDHHYIDSTATNVADELQKLGGARLIVATAASGSLSPLLGGLAYGGKLITVGVSSEPIEVFTEALIFNGVEILGSLTGSSVQVEQNLRFAQAQGIEAVIEPAKLTDAAQAYERMMSGAARFRMVLTT
jgi:propanol-preferring alcohol dehydrogenase